MSKLTHLRRQLASLRRTRQTQRWLAAHSAWLTAILVALAAVFVLDLMFSLRVLPRLVVMALAVAGIAWSFARYAVPLLGQRESEIDLALLVEGRQRISNDLVAALQFEQRATPEWGSPQLQTAVIDQASARSQRLDVFEGLSRGRAFERLAWLVVALLVAAAFVAFLPNYARVFGQRLLLSSAHYPTWTQIELVSVSGVSALDGQANPSPRDVRLAEGMPLEFLVRCTGRLPEGGEARLNSGVGRNSRVLELEPVPLEQRHQRLEEARSRLASAVEDPQVDIIGPWSDEVTELLRYDARDAASMIALASDDRAKLQDAATLLEQHLNAWPAGAEQAALFRARLDRLVEPVRYQLYLGDAWTDPATVEVIPAPAVELQLTATPPSYAKAAVTTARDSGSRQMAALEGSRIDVNVQCTNGKRLERVWLTLKDSTELQRFELQATDQQRASWSLDTAGTPLARLTQPLRFELQVTDEDGLHLPSPARAYIAIKPDRPPSGSAEIVHRVVLPTARPTIVYRVSDDYGIAAVRLRMQVEKETTDRYDAGSNSSSASGSDNASDARPDSSASAPSSADRDSDDSNPSSASPEPPADRAAPTHTVNLLAGGPIFADRLPRRGEAPVDLAPLGLTKGDRLKLTLEVVDYRGDTPGVSYLADSLVLDISDESGVLAAISEADERSEERMTDIIKQQLGIGDTP